MAQLVGGISWATATNGTLLSYLQALNGTLALQSNVNQTNTSYALNSTLANYFSSAQILGFTYYNVTNFPQNSSLMTYANWNATNTSYYLASNPSNFFNATGYAFTTYNITNGNFTINNQTTFNLFVVNGTNGRVGIGTNTSQNPLDVIGNINSTANVFAFNNLNLTNGYLYATNGSFISVTNSTYGYSLNNTLWQGNYSNFTNIYANVTAYNSSWSSITNTSYRALTNLTLYGGNVAIGQTASVNTLGVLGSLNVTGNVTLGNSPGVTPTNTVVIVNSTGTFAPACSGAYNHSMISNNSGWYVCGVTGAWTKIG